MLLKISSCQVLELFNEDSNAPLTKTAAAQFKIESEEVRRIIESEVKKHPTALFFRAKAIVADEMNSNGDFFSSDELIKSFGSFIGVPFYTNHQNSDIENAKGKIVHAEWTPKEKAIYVIGFVDREAYPHIARGIQEEYMSGVSMGCSVEYSLCSICKNKAASVDEYCDHIKYRKAKKFSGKAKDVLTGEVKSFKDSPVYEINYGIKFIELSAVGDPACRTCRINGVIDNNAYLQKAAKVQENLNTYRTAAMEKHADQQEIDSLNQALASLEQICINLIKNRQKVETEFASDLVKILSELQTFTDELVGAGYGQLQSGGAEGAPGGEAPLTPPGPGEPMPGAAPMPGGIPAAPVSETAPAIPGTVMGSPGEGFVKAPQAPMKPISSIIEKLQKISELMGAVPEEKDEEKLRGIDSVVRQLASSGITSVSASVDENGIERLFVDEGDACKLTEIASVLKENGFEVTVTENQGDDDMIRRTPVVADSQRKKAMKTLSEKWKEKKDLGEQSKNLNNITEEGDLTMRVEASRTNAPEVITEKQLDTNRQGYHPRQGEERDEVTQAQLGKEKGLYGRKDAEPEVVTEKQLESKRTDSTPEVVTQKQLVSERDDTAPESVTQDQLKDGYRTDSEKDVVTEKQLDGKSGDGKFWGRSAFSRTNLKTAKEHLDEVVTKIAEATVFCGATPSQAQEVVGELVGSFNSKMQLLDRISSETMDKTNIFSYASTFKYYAEKGIAVPPVSKEQVKSAIAAKLQSLVASDSKIHPELVVDVLDVVAEDADGMTAIAEAVDAQLKNIETVSKAGSSKSELRAALKTKANKEVEVAKPEPVKASAEKRTEERKEIKKTIAASHRIIATYGEVGLKPEMVEKGKDHTEAKKLIASYVRGVSATLGKKLAGITNVEVDGQKIDIRVQWDADADAASEVNLTVPPSEEGMAPETIPPEGETAGGGLDNLLGQPPAGAPATPPPAPEIPAAGTPMPATASAKKNSDGLTKEAQFGGMSGGGMAPAGGGAGASQPTEGLPSAPPMNEPPVQSLTEETNEGEEEDKSTIGEQMMPGSICPVCGSTNTETGRKDLPAGSFECNDCTAKYQYHVMMEVLNPDEVYSGKGEEGTVKEPEAPAMPVAASIDITKDSLVKMAAQEKKNGHTCPACGMTECKPTKQASGHLEYVCPACETETSKDIFVNKDDPAQLRMKVAWVLNPKKVFSKECKSCSENVQKFAAKIKVANMMKQAQGKEFPMANCVERVARKFGSNAVAHMGPCKGKPLAECVCKQLSKFDMRKVKHLDKLAAVYAAKDPMDECVEDHVKQNYTTAASETICKALKKKYAEEKDYNLLLVAFADEAGLNEFDLREMNDRLSADEVVAPTAPVAEDGEADIGEPIKETVTVTVELPKEEAQQVKEQIEEATVAETEVVPGEPDLGSASKTEVVDEGKAPVAEEQVIAASNKGENSMIKEAKKPTKVENIEKDVDAGIPRGSATLGNEGPQNIDVKEKKPEIPTGKATLGNEGPKNIDVPADLPDIPADDSKMGGEKETQKDMPAINTEIKGTVIAEVEIDEHGNIVKIAAVPTKVENIETEVDAGIPRAKATLGKEGPQNIDVEMKKPEVPTGKATLGQEGADNIDVKATLPDIPVDSSTIKGEKETQKDMPAINNKIKGTVIAEKREEQLKKLTEARYQKAMKVAAVLLAEKRITKEEFDDVVADLSKLDSERIESFANRLYAKPQVQKQASAEVMTVPVIQESKGMTQPIDKPLNEKLSGVFTIGTKQLNDALIEDGNR